MFLIACPLLFQMGGGEDIVDSSSLLYKPGYIIVSHIQRVGTLYIEMLILIDII